MSESMQQIIESNLDELFRLIDSIGVMLVEERDAAEYKTYAKADKTFVTDCDHASNMLLINGLQEIFGEVPVISEEGEEDVNSEILKSGNGYFMIDPIDGTHSFMKKGDFSIHVCFVENKKPVFGLVALPVDNEIYFTADGKSFVKQGDSITQITAAKTRAKNEQIFVTHNTLSQNQHFIDDICAQMKSFNYEFKEIISRPAGIKHCILARGDADVLIMGRSRDWDIAAPIIIMENAGATVRNRSGDEIIIGKNDEFKQDFFIASNNRDLADLIEIDEKYYSGYYK